MSASAPRIAIACTGIGLVQRGYERYFSDLFQLLKDDIDLTLFKGGGPQREKEIIPPFLDRNGRLLRLLPVHKLFGRTAFHMECLSFALGMLPHLRNGAFDVVHTIDPPLARLLYRLRRRLGLEFRLLLTEGAGMAPSDYPPADFTQHVCEVTLENAIAYGYDPDLMNLVPCGFYPERFETTEDRRTLRNRYGIDDATFVILSVAALNRNHKRTDYLIDEVARLDGKVLLMLDGSVDHGDPELIDYARARLGDRCRISHVPSDKVRDLYAMADVMVHAALSESFGLAIVEAASTGLPVIIHDAPHFRWLVPNPACWLDMRMPGVLTARLSGLMSDAVQLGRLRAAEPVRRMFAWPMLKPRYLDLYHGVARLEPRAVGETDCRRRPSRPDEKWGLVKEPR
jgi:glycosyltransferase involved in cell wall biosynthesis